MCSFNDLGKVLLGLNSMYFVFFTFMHNLLALNHSFNFFSSVFMSLYSWGIFGDEAVTVVSSAKLRIFKLVEFCISLT